MCYLGVYYTEVGPCQQLAGKEGWAFIPRWAFNTEIMVIIVSECGSSHPSNSSLVRNSFCNVYSYSYTQVVLSHFLGLLSSVQCLSVVRVLSCGKA